MVLNHGKLEKGWDVGSLSQMNGSAVIITADIANLLDNGTYDMNGVSTYKVNSISDCRFDTKTVLDASSRNYNDAGDWVGLLYAVQALGSVAWALLLPKFRSRKFSYILSLFLGAGGFLMLAFVPNKWLLFLAFILIGCAWAAMLAWPFTILTNSLKSGNIGAYLGLFNGTITIPQIVAAITGGWILTGLSRPGEVAPEYLMMMIAGISIAIGAACVLFIKEGKKEDDVMEVTETPVLSDNI